jgi:hypothetical protein
MHHLHCCNPNLKEENSRPREKSVLRKAVGAGLVPARLCIGSRAGTSPAPTGYLFTTSTGRLPGTLSRIR